MQTERKTLAMFQAAFAGLVIRNAVRMLEQGKVEQAREMLVAANATLAEQDDMAMQEVTRNVAHAREALHHE